MQKTIQINPDFLQVSKKYKKRRKKNQEHSLKANDIKKLLLNKIKEHQIKSQAAGKREKEFFKKKEEAELNDNFRASVNFLNTVTKEKKREKKGEKKKTS